MTEDQEIVNSRPSYTPDETSCRFYARVFTKFQVSTIISFGGQATYGPNRLQKLADEMVDGWGPSLTRFFYRPDATAAFLNELLHRAALLTLV